MQTYNPKRSPDAPPSKSMFTFEFIQNAFYTFNFLFLLMGLTLLGIAIWMAVEFNFMVIILGHHYSVFVYMAIATGGFIGIAAIIGCIGTLNLHKTILQIFLACIVFIIITLFVICILAFVFRSQIGNSVKNEMKKSLVEDYGINLNKRHNRRVTRSWDNLQEKLYCCAVETEGWAAYRESEWFKIYGNPNPEVYDMRLSYVPRSCCVRDRFWRYIDINTCQKWMVGPPGSLDAGSATNHVLYYKGCYDAVKDEFAQHAAIMGALVLVFAVFMILYVLSGLFMLKHIPPPTKPLGTGARPKSREMIAMSSMGESNEPQRRPYRDEPYPSDDGAYPGVYHDDPEESYPEDDRYAAERYAEKQPYHGEHMESDSYPPGDYDVDYSGRDQGYPVDVGHSTGYSNA